MLIELWFEEKIHTTLLTNDSFNKNDALNIMFSSSDNKYSYLYQCSLRMCKISSEYKKKSIPIVFPSSE